jgi:hypothetical protein
MSDYFQHAPDCDGEDHVGYPCGHARGARGYYWITDQFEHTLYIGNVAVVRVSILGDLTTADVVEAAVYLFPLYYEGNHAVVPVTVDADADPADGTPLVTFRSK